MSNRPWFITPLMWEALRLRASNFGWAYQFRLEYNPKKKLYYVNPISYKLIPWLTVLFVLNSVTVLIPSGLLIMLRFYGTVTDVPLFALFVCAGSGLLDGGLAVAETLCILMGKSLVNVFSATRKMEMRLKMENVKLFGRSSKIYILFVN